MNTIPKQTKQFRADVFDQDDQDRPLIVVATVRHDDQCGNGHNTFSITGEIYDDSGSIRDGVLTHAKTNRILGMTSCGCVHDDIAKYIPELAQFIKWHLTSTDGPMHYIANTVYHVQERKLDYARSSAVWPEATDEDLLWTEPELTAKLNARLPELMKQFKAAVESLGFTY